MASEREIGQRTPVQATRQREFVYHGESRQWSSTGKLIGSFTATDGTGTFREWFDNGQLFGEIPMVNGQFMGLQRGWDESGYLLVERFWYRGSSCRRSDIASCRGLTQPSRSIPTRHSRPSHGNGNEMRESPRKKLDTRTVDLHRLALSQFLRRCSGLLARVL
jgi:antitoxin component YwqK of YwqJK toxin-antitoxin module